ncbi:hypothetical protein CMO92_00370 [Candidatus Woesearchaeota archaeon]|nr:hypothetical protein [Candidatus Woesearchaeota archaeon]
MRILSVGCIHGNKKFVEDLAQKAEDENVDLVILAGDLSSHEGNTEGVIGPFLKKNKKVIFVPGNHDSLATADFLAEFYGVKNIHGYSVRYKDIGIFGCSAVNCGINQINDKETYDLLKKGFESVRYLKKKIMVTHVHPAGTKMEKLSQFVEGNKAVEKAIKQFKPDIMLCSHLHEGRGLEEKIGTTKVVNVATKPQIFDV